MSETTNTNQWSLAIHRVTEASAEIWVGTLFPTLKKPDQARITITHPDGKTSTKKITKADWQRPFSALNQRFFCLRAFSSLKAGQHYQVQFERRIEKTATTEQRWQVLQVGEFSTLPARIPLKGNKPFTIGLGSCFYDDRDGGRASDAYRALYQHGNDKVRPDITMLTGDQVYLDIGFDSLSLLTDEIHQRIADDYAQHWKALSGILSSGGTWMLPDDHEYWNDYPFYDALIPTLLSLKIKRVRKAWTQSAIDAVQNIQRCPRVETFTIGKDLSVCLADLRSFRSDDTFLPDADFKSLSQWAKQLTSPGLLVSPQPLIVEENPSEKNLMSFEEQYKELLEALAHSGHDIVLLTGDVHFGRIATAPLGNNGAKLVEVIASPLSNLTGMNGIATATAKKKPNKFPDPKMIKMANWKPAKVNYNKQFHVSHTSGWPSFSYPKKRTHEHFMTLSFSRTQQGTLELSVDAWRVREQVGRKELPAKDFKKSFRCSLK